MDCRVFALLLAALPLWAQAAEPANEGCINVEVNGYKALSYECLSEQMANPKGTPAARKNQEALNVPIEQRAPNKLGLYNQSATRIRMGNTFGHSALPQRPPQ